MGFLSRLLGRPSMDILIAGVPRSGTSMLGNLMTSVPDTLILYEPHVGMRKPSRYTQDQMSELSLPSFASNRALTRFVAGHATRWGVKEVMTRHIRPALRLHSPERVLIVARDIHHAALSIYERAKQIPHRFKPGWRGQGIIETAGFLVDLHASLAPDRRIVVHYERFVAEADYRRQVEEQLGWPLAGNLGIGLGKQGRDTELERHGDGITARSVELRNAESDPEKLSFAADLVAQCTAYQQLFGYSTETNRRAE